MPRALALETSGRIGSIALVDDQRVIAEEQFAHGLKHAAQIIPIIDRLVRSAGWTPRSLEHVYLSAGPGSFTGLRIGVTLAKMLALASGVKLVAVPTLSVLAENAPPEAKHLIIVLDAKRDQIFTARFARQGERWIEIEPARLDTLLAMLSRSPRPVHLLGEGLPMHDRFVPVDDRQVVVTDQDFWRAKASVVARLGLELASRGEFTDPLSLTPIYIRKPEAEEKWEAAQARL
jgi:tRNA threonylcarbamoyladenosine biosynthesis protein TsaB